MGGLKIIKNSIPKSEFLELLPPHCIKTSAIEIITKEGAKNYITVFMKGDPDNPKDGYQEEVIEALNKHDFIFGYVNVIKDPDLREHLKDITGCKSYPQIFLNGKFYSGRQDFIDLLESGKALSIIPTAEIIMQPMEKFKNLLTKDRLFVFMEGTPLCPRDKKTMKLIQFLRLNQYKYKYYDVFVDLEVRNSAIEYSKWTEFPQIYLDEQLIGDADIAQTVLPTIDLQEIKNH